MNTTSAIELDTNYRPSTGGESNQSIPSVESAGTADWAAISAIILSILTFG